MACPCGLLAGGPNTHILSLLLPEEAVFAVHCIAMVGDWPNVEAMCKCRQRDWNPANSHANESCVCISQSSHIATTKEKREERVPRKERNDCMEICITLVIIYTAIYYKYNVNIIYADEVSISHLPTHHSPPINKHRRAGVEFHFFCGGTQMVTSTPHRLLNV